MSLKNFTTHCLALMLLAFANLALAHHGSFLIIDGAYARAVPPTAKNSGAFMLIENRGEQDRRLVDAVSDVSNVTELHTHLNDNGVMRMRKVPFIEVPAGGSVKLQPGSYHVMLIGLKKPLNDGDPVNITLTFDDGSQQTVKLQARKMMGGGHMHH